MLLRKLAKLQHIGTQTLMRQWKKCFSTQTRNNFSRHLINITNEFESKAVWVTQTRKRSIKSIHASAYRKRHSRKNLELKYFFSLSTNGLRFDIDSLRNCCSAFSNTCACWLLSDAKRERTGLSKRATTNGFYSTAGIIGNCRLETSFNFLKNRKTLSEYFLLIINHWQLFLVTFYFEQVWILLFAYLNNVVAFSKSIWVSFLTSAIKNVPTERGHLTIDKKVWHYWMRKNELRTAF